MSCVRRVFILFRIAICSVFGQIALVWRSRGCVIVVPGFAIGDIVFTSVVVREYKKLHPLKKFCIVVDGNRKGDCDAAELVGDVFDRIERNVPPIPRRLQFPTVHKLWPDMWSMMCPKHGNINLIDLFSQLITGRTLLTKAIPITVPLPEYCEDWNLFPNGKTVLICPGATSTAMPDADNIWISIGNHLRQKGFSVVFNAKDDSHCKGFDTVFYDVKKTAAFVEHCGYVISLRSGLADLLAYVTTARILAVYSRNFDDWCWTVADAWKAAGYQMAGEEFLQYWSLSGLFDRDGLYDCFYDGIDSLKRNVEVLVGVR